MGDAIYRKAEIDREEEMKEPEAMAEMPRLTAEAASDDDEPVAVSDMSIYDPPLNDEGMSEEDKEFFRKTRIETRQAKKVHEDKFEALTKEPGKYMEQHWHLKEWPVTDESIDRKIPRDEYLLLCYDPELWNIHLYGDLSNIMPKTLQIYSLKLTAADDDYPLQVYGRLRLVSTDSYSQVIFHRRKNECQTITKEDPYLVLTGPLCHPVAPPCCSLCIVPDLRLKGITGSEDKHLTLSARCEKRNKHNNHNYEKFDIIYKFFGKTDTVTVEDPYLTHLPGCCKEHKLCKCKVQGTHKQYLLEMTRGIVTYSVLATIGVQVVGSESPNGSLPGRSLFTAYMESLRDAIDRKVVLLDSRDGKNPVKFYNHKFDLSRTTICVEHFGILIVYIEQGEIKKELRFKPQESGQKVRFVDIGPCKIQVTVEWSLYWKYVRRFVESRRG